MEGFYHVNQLKAEFDRLLPFPIAAFNNLKKAERVEWIYNSNAIEGNTLSLIETKIILEEGLAIGGKRIQEHFEVINHSEAISFIENQVNRTEPLDEQTLKKIHHLILKNIDDENAGTYRSISVRISGSQHEPPHFLQVPHEMKDLFDWYEREKNRLHPVELAALFHFKFVYIHPFADGNGRTARLLMNLILMSHGFPPAIVKAENEQRLAYYETLEMASVRNNVQPFIALIAGCVEESLTNYLKAVR
ncbi:Fic family protein [Planococcus maritimus]|uniref:Fic family protein n=1 Tax=Planococcus maritimus TaxID=192421 RepID=UPI000797E865|nr:Fic family protein [Planococcus maritimus]KYG60023.1 cell filamentation protein Fic [Planococcus maritimus]OED33711.1 cell filamentation protein Fic [Planococcus maritimus]